jgi:hypothetical protein
VSHKHARDRAEKHKSCSFARLPHELWRQRIVLSVICQLPSVRVRSRVFPQMGGCYLLKHNRGVSGIQISVPYWRCSLISVSVIRGFTVFFMYVFVIIIYKFSSRFCVDFLSVVFSVWTIENVYINYFKIRWLFSSVSY